jgi:sensor histidine kinase YesM
MKGNRGKTSQDNNNKPGVKSGSFQRELMRKLLVGWYIPLIGIFVIVTLMTAWTLSKQTIRVVKSSAKYAASTVQLRLEDLVTASKEASYNPTIMDAYQNYKNGGTIGNLKNDTKIFLKQQYAYNDSCEAAVLYFKDNPDNLCYALNYSMGGKFSDVSVFRQESQAKIDKISENLRTDTALMYGGDKLYLVRNILNSNFETIAVLSLQINTDKLFESMDGSWGEEDYQVLLGNQIIREGNDPKYFPKEKTGKLNAIVRGKTGYIIRTAASQVSDINRARSNQKLVFVTRLNTRIIFGEIIAFFIVLIFILIFVFPLSDSIRRFFTNNVSKPISKMMTAYEKIGKGDYGYRIDNPDYIYEFRIMEDGFNKMSEELTAQFEKIYVEEIKLRDARINALQLQINPHFMNNTLEIINWEARIAGNDKISKMIEALSTMLSATMNRSKRSFVPLSEELSYVDAYMYIIKERLGDRLVTIKEKDDDINPDKLLVPRFIIQPIVENAIEHGTDENKKVEVRFRIKKTIEGDLAIEVENSGPLPEEDREKINKLLNEEMDYTQTSHVSIGIRNVHQRVRFLCGENYGFSIKSTSDGHTLSTIKIKWNET